jgi:ribonuclease R
VAIDLNLILELVRSAGRLVGTHELLIAGGLNPGQQTDLKRVLRELVKRGDLVREGKRYGVPAAKPAQRSGPAWGGKKPATVRREASRSARADVPAAPRNAAGPGSRPRRGADEPRGRGAEAARGPRGQLVVGTIHHHRDGFAFVKPIVGEVSEDIFVPPDEARKALDHDQVRVEVVPGRDGRTMGRIVDVTSRTRQQVIGTYEENARGAWVEPRETELGRILVPKTQLARPGDVVKVRLGIGGSLFRGQEALTGEVSGSLGSEADHSVEVLSLAFARGFSDEFPPEVMDEADLIPLEVSAEEARSEHRRDLRKLPLITIDGEDARDFDDAVYCERHGRGGWRLVVAIADVSHYVRVGTALDGEGLRRATSVYLPGRVLPMLPERLSNGICSLRPDVDRLCMVADLVIDAQGRTQESELYPAVMRSHARCTYTEVHDVLAGKDVPGRTELRPHFELLMELARTLTKMRLARGAIDFDLPEHKVELGDDGLPVRLVKRERWESHRLVEECMLAANEAVARFFREQELPTVNRYHGDPDEERLELFLRLLGAYGIEVPQGEFTSSSLNAVLQQLEGHPEQRALNQLALRSMMQAVYSSQHAGHYGLGAEDYLHFTSPIRRYPDLLVHRLLKQLWGRGKRRPTEDEIAVEEEELEVLAVQCSERERAAMQVEREVNQLYACLLVQDRVGEAHEGTVCGLSENGFFVQLDELMVEGFVRGDDVYPNFEFDQSTYRLNFGDGRVVKVGLRCEVEIRSVNLERRQIDFELLDLEEAQPADDVGGAAGHLVEDRPGVSGRSRSQAGGRGRFGLPNERPAAPGLFGRAGREATSGRAGRDERGGKGGRFGRQERGGASGGRFGREDRGGASGGRFGREDRGGASGGRFGREERGGASGGRFGREERGGASGGRFGREDRGGASGGRFGREERGGASGGRFGREDRGGASGGRFARDDRGAAGAGRPGREDRGASGGGRFGRDDRGSASGGRFGRQSRSGAGGEKARPGSSGGRFGGGRTAEAEAPVRPGRMAPSKRFPGGKEGRRSEQPPPQPWEKKGEAERDEETPRERFDPHAVLDRLWKQRGGGGGRGGGRR